MGRKQTRTISVRGDQREFLDEHDEVNFSAICRQALDQFINQYQAFGNAVIVEHTNDDADCTIVVDNEFDSTKKGEVENSDSEPTLPNDAVIASLKFTPDSEGELNNA